ncbi:MAG: DUF2752 domain-containing protein [Eubacteriales bacterium]|nr:DUF2752 domain-containing protein [Eubacteriales bacterium]
MNIRILELMFHMPCLFHALTGLYCPGCGGTRAVKYLLQGKLLASLQYHPLVLYGAVVAALELGSWLLAKRLGRKELYLGRESLFLYTGLGIVAVNWIVKNVCLVVWGIDLLSVPLL